MTDTNTNQAGTDDPSASSAQRIAAELRHLRNDMDFRLAKVTSLLHAFRRPGEPTKLGEMLKQLEGAGVHYETGWPAEEGVGNVRRSGVLQLSLPDDETLVDQSGADPTIQVSSWTLTNVSAERSVGECARRDGEEVLWFNIEPTPIPDSVSSAAKPGRERLAMKRPGAGKGQRRLVSSSDTSLANDPFEQRVKEITGRLEACCDGLNEEMIRDLLRQDPQPKVDSYGDERDGVRGVSVVAAIARERPGEDDDSDGIEEELVFQLVEMVVGPGWIITCWHHSSCYTGAADSALSTPILREPFMSHVRHRWLQRGEASQHDKQPQTSGDLGLYLARALVDTYEATYRMMERWVESWEIEFFSSLNRGDKARRLKESAGEISNLSSMTGEIRRRLTAVEHARLTTVDKAWFPKVSQLEESLDRNVHPSVHVRSLDEAVKSSRIKFTALSGHIRDNMNLLMLQSTATQQEANERLQDYLGKVTGLVLVPTLVVGLFGANTRLPGGGSWSGFEIMLVLMLLSAVAVYFVMRKLSP